MMKLRKQDRQNLERICADLERAMQFVADPETALMRKHRLASCDFFASTFPAYAGQKWSPITKECGSDFAGAFAAVRSLRAGLNKEQPTNGGQS